jgi:hypothetical protein
MSVSSFTWCVTCNEQGPELGDAGMMGLPDLAIGKVHNEDWGVTSYNFGWIYDGLKSIDLLPVEVEVYRAFLEQHAGHELFLGNDHMDASEMPAVDHANMTRYEAPAVDSIAGSYEVSCPANGDRFRTSWDGENFRAFEERALLAEEVANFLARLTASGCLDSITRTTPSVEPYEDLGNLLSFLQAHQGDILTARLIPGGVAAA